MVGRLSNSARDCIVKLLLAVSDGDGEEAATALARLGAQQADFDRDTFRADMDDLVHRSVELGSDLQAGAAVLDMTRIASRCGLRPAPELAVVGKALLNLDQVAKHLDPGFSPTEAIRRHTAAILQARMTTSSGGLLGAAMEARDFTVQLPGRVNKVMDAVADGKFQVKIDAIDQPQLHAPPAAARQPAGRRPRTRVPRGRRSADDADPDGVPDPGISQHRGHLLRAGRGRWARPAALGAPLRPTRG